eukprot:517032-Hanusia_phi.AAC.2
MTQHERLQQKHEVTSADRDGEKAADLWCSPENHDVAIDHEQTILFAKKSIIEAQIAMKVHLKQHTSLNV